MATPLSKATEHTESNDYRAIRISCVLDPINAWINRSICSFVGSL